MSFDLPYASFANYSPRGSSQLSQKSRKFCGLIKAGKIRPLRFKLDNSDDPETGDVADYLGIDKAANLQPFLNENTTLVPVPRSAPLAEGALWPSKVIADYLVEHGYGREVWPCIQRATAVRKSSSQGGADSRPSVQEHYESFTMSQELMAPESITLIDDVLTLGRTTYACAQKIKDVFPDVPVRVFTMVRTQGFIPNIEAIADPSTGNITFNENTGKTSRHP